MAIDKLKEKSFEYLFCSALGYPIRKLATMPITSALAGSYMNTAFSRRIIDGFAEKNGIDLSEYLSEEYKCFNDFFTRNIKPGARPVDMEPGHLISPCDGHLSAYKIDKDSVFEIKGSEYNVSDLLEGSNCGDEYLNGTCLVLRLAVDNYHRYCYIDEGKKTRNYHVDGRFDPVRPVVIRKRPVFVQNTREYTFMDTENFGRVAQIEVGACLVGRIHNHHESCLTHRGKEKGLFLFGGSTIVLLFKENTLDIPKKIFTDSLYSRELPVKYGQMIGKAKKD